MSIFDKLGINDAMDELISAKRAENVAAYFRGCGDTENAATEADRTRRHWQRAASILEALLTEGLSVSSPEPTTVEPSPQPLVVSGRTAGGGQFDGWPFRPLPVGSRIWSGTKDGQYVSRATLPDEIAEFSEGDGITGFYEIHPEGVGQWNEIALAKNSTVH
jgi:hypothetical protein